MVLDCTSSASRNLIPSSGALAPLLAELTIPVTATLLSSPKEGAKWLLSGVPMGLLLFNSPTWLRPRRKDDQH